MLGQLAPWLNINTQEWGNLAARGAQLDIERQRLAEEVQERKAADSLRRDQLQFNRQDAQTQNQQAAAALALRQAALQQGGLLGQKKIDQSGQTAAAKLAETTNRDANTNQNRSDLLDLRERIAGSKPEASTISLSSGSDANNKTEIKLTKSEYANYLKAQKQWASQAPPETVPGKMWGENKNPAYADYLKKNPAPNPTDFLTSAASTLTAGTPTATPAPAPTQPAAAALTGGQSAAPGAKPKAPKDKVAMANAVALIHPEWTKKDVIDYVNAQ